MNDKAKSDGNLIQINRPEEKYGVYRNEFNWPDLNLKVIVDRITDDGKAELSFYSGDGNEEVLLHHQQVNLLASTIFRDLPKILAPQLKADGCEIDWHTVLTYVSGLTMRNLRKGGNVQFLGNQPESTRLEYQLFPILQKNQPTCVFAPGGTAKSYIADLICLLVQLGVISNPLGWRPLQGNVLYLDWESSFEDHARRVWAIKKGLKISSPVTFRYLRCFQPLTDEIYNVLPIISDNAIALVIVDSQLASQGDGNDQAQLANKFFNTVRAFGCTSLIIDHVTKESMNFNSESLSPYGSIVKYNRLRSVFNLEKTQNEGEDTIDLCMRHTKNNEGKLLPRQGIRIKFNNFGDDLESVIFEKFNVADNPKMAEKLPVRDQLVNALRNGRQAATVEELGEVTGHDAHSIRTILNREKKYFVKVDSEKNTWGILTELDATCNATPP